MRGDRIMFNFMENLIVDIADKIVAAILAGQLANPQGKPDVAIDNYKKMLERLSK